MSVKISHIGEWEDTFAFLNKASNLTPSISSILREGGEKGVEALREATPILTGRASNSWRYRIKHDAGSLTIEWYNIDIEGGYNVVLLVQYGHGTKQGHYIQGRDFINPAIQPVFDEIAEMVWKEVTNAEYGR